MRRTLVSLALAGLFFLSAPPAQGMAGTPACASNVQPLGPTAPNAIDPERCETLTGRIFPEAIARPEYLQADASGHANTGFASDTFSFPEFEAGLRLLESRYPDLITVHEVARSVGWVNSATQAHDTFPVYMVELTNKQSPVPMADRQALLFMLSIHGLEQGGREGGMRVLEDLVKGIGIGGETVQDGAGLPTPIARPGLDGQVQTYQHYLDFMRVFLLFPNPDGWVHEEADYISGSVGQGAAPCTGHCRGNGHVVDLNRQAPTLGWQNPNRDPVGEPEPIGYYNWMLQQGIDWSYGIDIHGMLNHQNFVAIMLPAASMTPQEMQRTFRLAETLNGRLNTDPHFDAWRNAFAAAESGQEAGGTVCLPAGDPTGQLGECPLAGSALAAAGSSTFAEYYTVIDAIGYTDSGFNGDYFSQDSGLDAPGFDLELAYSIGEEYPSYAQINDYHVKTVREVVKAFMDAAALDVRISFETHGRRTTVVEPSFVATSLDDAKPTPGGWADTNAGDDLWDYGVNGGFTARPARYWEDLKPFVRAGDEPGVLTLLPATRLDAEALALTDTLVLPGSAIDDLETDPGKIAAVRAWVEAGGDLVLTDESLRFFDLSGLTSGAVDSASRYMGGIKMDLSQAVFYPQQDTGQPRNVRGGVKQTYEPTPIGYETGANAAPNWFIDAAKYGALAGGTVAGLECGTPQLADPCTGNGVALGTVPLGAGRIQFIGALLPDPTEEFYHPYGLDAYATTYSGNQILRNMLLWTESFQAPPVVVTDGTVVDSDNEPQGAGTAPTAAPAPAKDSPGAGGLLVLGALAAAAIGLRRRREA
ncbi:MAG: hypothetical protein QOJ26_7 [Thermoplasmata archaeon]|nr:hypothetical protein [Thermoplasmata archaeon]